MKKSQVSLFVIIGLIIVIIVGTLILLRMDNSKTEFDIERIRSGDAKLDQDFLDAYVEHCIEISTIEAEKRFGLDKKASIAPIAAYVEYSMPECLDNFNAFEEQNFDVTSKDPKANAILTNNALIVELNYEVRMSRGTLKLNHDDTTYTLPRSVTEDINPDKTTLITSTDGGFVIEIEPGTKAYVGDEEVEEITLKNLDKHFNGLSNSVLLGRRAFYAAPHGVSFSKPVKVIAYYDDIDVPPFINEENLKIGYYHDTIGIWVGLPTVVDSEVNKMTAYTNHFSVYGITINCGGKDEPITSVATPTIVKQICDNKVGGGCEGWNEGTAEGLGELYKNEDDIKDDIDFVEYAAKRNEMIELVFKESTDNEIEKLIDVDGSDVKWDEDDEAAKTLWNEKIIKQHILTCEVVERELTLDDLTIFDEGYSLSEVDEGTIECPDGSIVDDSTVTDCTYVENIVTYLKIKDLITPDNKKIFAKTSDCESVCEGTCYAFAEKDSREVSFCYLGSLKAYKYAKTNKNADGTWKRTSPSEPEVGLMGRGYYQIEFEKNGNACVASQGTNSQQPPTGTSLSYSDWTSQIPSTESSSVEKGDRFPQIVPVKRLNQTDGNYKDTFNVEIVPKCLSEDDCAIRSAYFDETGAGNPRIYFFLEVENNGSDPDACIQGSAEINFMGTGVKADHSLLCNAELVGKIDYVKGFCSSCLRQICNKAGSSCKDDAANAPDAAKEEIVKYIWRPTTDSTTCLNYNNQICAASVIGKTYPNPTNEPNCVFCKPGSNPLYGEVEIIDADNCDCLSKATLPATTENNGFPTAVTDNLNPPTTEEVP